MRAPLTRLRRWAAVPLLLGITVLLDRPRATDAPHRAEWLSAGDARVRTLRAGRGDTTLVLLHGFAESLFTWRAVVDPLAAHFRVVALDLPGFAGSEKPDASYTMPAMVDRLTAFVDEWTTGPLVAVGHSLGGQLAAALALARPERIVALVLIAPAGWRIGLGGVADAMTVERAEALSWYLSSRAFLLPEHDEEWLAEPPAASGYSLMTDPAYRRSAARLLREFDFTGFRDAFQRVTAPTLLIWGDLDPVVPLSVADSIERALPCSRLVVLDRTLHRPQVERPDTVVAEIHRFAARPACEPRAANGQQPR